MRFVAWRGLSGVHRQDVECHSPWTRDAENPRPITISDIEIAELDASLRATIKAEVIAALAFIPRLSKGELFGRFRCALQWHRPSASVVGHGPRGRPAQTAFDVAGSMWTSSKGAEAQGVRVPAYSIDRRCRHPDRVSPGRPKVSSRASI